MEILEAQTALFFPPHIMLEKKTIRDKQHSSNHNINRLASDERLKKSIGTHSNS